MSSEPQTTPEPNGDDLDVVVIEYEDMTPAQKRIVDAINEPTIRVPESLTQEQLEQWLLDTFLKGGTNEQ